MSSTSLTDRYVWTVTRQLPEETGPDIARELRGTIEETVEGRVAAGEDPLAAERATILGLGDPDVLAREYGGRPNHLIGPDYFPAWVRLVRLLLAIVVPIAVLGSVVAHAIAGDAGFGGIVGEAAVVALHAGVHIAFWTALVFALVERFGSAAEREQVVASWNPDGLADPADRDRRASLAEMLFEVVTTVVVIGLCIWQFGGVGERGLQVLDPDLALGWQAVVVGLLLVDVLATVAAWARGGWGVGLAAVSLTSAVVSGVVLVWLTLSDRLLADIPAALEDAFGLAADWSVPLPAVAAGLAIISAWEALTALRRLRDGRRAS